MSGPFEVLIPVHVTYEEASAILSALQARIEELGGDLRNPHRNHVYIARSREECQAAFDAIAAALPRRSVHEAQR